MICTKSDSNIEQLYILISRRMTLSQFAHRGPGRVGKRILSVKSPCHKQILVVCFKNPRHTQDPHAVYRTNSRRCRGARDPDENGVSLRDISVSE